MLQLFISDSPNLLYIYIYYFIHCALQNNNTITSEKLSLEQSNFFSRQVVQLRIQVITTINTCDLTSHSSEFLKTLIDHEVIHQSKDLLPVILKMSFQTNYT
ncbi:hypothetical protein EDEG_00755 [Edhazardia aedis USNM 41457]|uniref:Uncharacterized protein n=1 Tax=Edhazardia aedis (strain USNM 41457) TaxID=1003232 RepID=J9DCD2_EDHAE|nr:hypothetical protein EDEG_00755 [Edhazardia aedis USNM 41457]|eukprot:EJW05144.1 hypothetical protein EDEG_00755 [Edhazardia aedis USNM 41457]